MQFNPGRGKVMLHDRTPRTCDLNTYPSVHKIFLLSFTVNLIEYFIHISHKAQIKMNFKFKSIITIILTKEGVDFIQFKARLFYTMFALAATHHRDSFK